MKKLRCVASNLDVLEPRWRRLRSFYGKTTVKAGSDVVFDVFRAKSNRSAPSSDSTNWNFSRFDQLIDQAAGNVEPFGNVGHSQQAIQFFIISYHLQNEIRTNVAQLDFRRPSIRFAVALPYRRVRGTGRG